ncbi:MAG: hypothetical protein HYY24_20580 [Verrucomicrobia bacterium]|nr:hypothetical protein [Verrucomicrobiota bacterium]
MKLIATDELAANPRKVLNKLRREGSVIITQNGHPRGILTPTSEETLVEDVQDRVRARARRAVSEIRRESARRGLDRLALRDIDREIAAARKARRARSPA